MAKEKVTQNGGSKKRVKSLEDLFNQSNRISRLDRELRHREGVDLDNQRKLAKRANDAYFKYESNITNSKDFKKEDERIMQLKSGSRERAAAINASENRKYSGYQNADTTKAVASTVG